MLGTLMQLGRTLSGRPIEGATPEPESKAPKEESVEVAKKDAADEEQREGEEGDDVVVRLTLFPTSSHWAPPPDADATATAAGSRVAERQLVVPARGWVRVTRRRSTRRRLVLGLGRRLLSPIRSDRSAESDKAFDDRFGAFLDAPLAEQAAVRLVITGLAPADKDRKPFTGDENAPPLQPALELFPKLDTNGLFSDVFKIPESLVKTWQSAASDAFLVDHLEIVAVKISGLQAGVVSQTTSSIIDPIPGISIITDLDDTIKDSDVHRGAMPALNNALFTPSATAIDGMPNLFRLFYLNNPTAAFHYVSASPFQLIDPILDFLSAQDFPPGSVTLRDVWSQTSRRAYKDAIVKDLFTKYPFRKFILIGDAGEKDAEIYARVMREYPGRVAMILIRDVSGGKDAEQIKVVQEALKEVEDAAKVIFTDPGHMEETIGGLEERND
ncbi:hypothetical protein HK100_000364 [Physocladia obscura]|uniref:Phosphatidate phosphatase APP1 catalytic domain-containing protein n=1 Tax=Physocladia obscura TaxID=109957 RepID=A0AAD5SZF4_9FUNG|nr:hypothetical protein HK100_000364 [Physocladia obscura]